jgi:hypothetical protein
MDYCQAGHSVKTGQLSASGRFGQFKPESENPVRKAELRMNPAIESIERAWKGCMFTGFDISEFAIASFYPDYLAKIGSENQVYSAKDIETFSIMLAGFQEEKSFLVKAGLFLSALINRCEDDAFVIHAAHLDGEMVNIGYRNMKNILLKGGAEGNTGLLMKDGTLIIEGDADVRLGWKMSGGAITVEGNSTDRTGYEMSGGAIVIKGNSAEDCGSGMHGGMISVHGNVGGRLGVEMSGGTILVKGNTGFCPGIGMKGGKIIVKGDAGRLVGDGMKGGEIHVEGKIHSLAYSEDIVHGKIFHNGELIVDK